MRDQTAAAKTPPWVARLRRAARVSGEAKSTEAEVLTLAAALAPEEPAWALEVTQTMAEATATPARRLVDLESAARYTICQVGSERVAIAVDHVLEVRQGGRYAALPAMAGFVRGVANRKGEAIAVIGLAELLGTDSGGNPGWERLLLVRPPGETCTVGFVVDRVIDMTLLEGPAPAGDEGDDGGGELASFLGQVCEFEGEPVRVLDVEGLIRSGVIEMLAQARRDD